MAYFSIGHYQAPFPKPVGLNVLNGEIHNPAILRAAGSDIEADKAENEGAIDHPPFSAALQKGRNYPAPLALLGKTLVAK